MLYETQIKKLYAIAARYKATDTYISYIEYVLQGQSFSARDLANKIYKAAMIKREASIHKRAADIKVNTNLVADQMRSAKEFARVYGLMPDYAFYLERLVLNDKQFDMGAVLDRLSDAAITAYDMRLRREIDAATGITIVGGYHDAV